MTFSYCCFGLLPVSPWLVLPGFGSSAGLKDPLIPDWFLLRDILGVAWWEIVVLTDVFFCNTVSCLSWRAVHLSEVVAMTTAALAWDVWVCWSILKDGITIPCRLDLQLSCITSWPDVMLESEVLDVHVNLSSDAYSWFLGLNCDWSRALYSECWLFFRLLFLAMTGISS